MTYSQKPKMWIWALVFSAIFLFIGIGLVKANHEVEKEYKAPVYISKNFTIKTENNGTYMKSYTLEGELVNLRSDDVYIEAINFVFSGKEGNTKYTGNYTIKDAFIPANGALKIHEENLVPKENRYSAKYSSVNVSSIRSNGTEYHIKYSSNGSDFDMQVPSLEGGVLLIAVGSLFTLCVIIYKVSPLIELFSNRRKSK